MAKIGKQTSNKTKKKERFFKFFLANAKLLTTTINTVIDSTKKTVLDAFCPFKAGNF